MSPSVSSKMRRAAWPLLLRGWAIVWMLAVPLFHVHPEADRHHGETGHVHGGTVHTVFSEDLDGEFGSHGTSGQAGRGMVSHSSTAGQEHGELGFSVLNDSSERKFFKPLLAQVFVVAIAVRPTPDGSDSAEPDNPAIPSSTRFVHELPSRAPPALLV